MMRQETGTINIILFAIMTFIETLHVLPLVEQEQPAVCGIIESTSQCPQEVAHYVAHPLLFAL